MSDALHPDWQSWVLENLAAGASVKDVARQLVDEGIDRSVAEKQVALIHRSPAYTVARRLSLRSEALELMLRLRRLHRDQFQRPIERVSLPTVTEFEDRYLRPGEPVIFTDLVPRSRAFGRWTHDYFSQTHGDVPVQACVGRREHKRPDADWRELAQTMPMRDFIARLSDPAVGNDVYMIGKNGAIRHPQIHAELQDVALPESYFGSNPTHQDTGLWIGGAGTHTPLHHDGNSAILMQFFGRKRFRMIPPESPALLDVSDGVYSLWDPPPQPEPDALETYREFELSAGEALLLPAGWWHQVDSLSPSISLTFTELASGIDCSWYRPGTRLRGRPDPTRGKS